jgi:RNA polymerase sigma-70 factor (sigma-E family)
MEPVKGDDAVVTALVESPESLYRRGYRGAVRLAVALVDSPATAEDIVQDAFAQVWLRWERIDQPEAYLRACIVNSCRRELRRRQLRRRMPEQPAGAAVDREARLLLDAVRALPPRRRAVVVLRFYEDLSEAEIARLLGMRPGTVKATLHQALAQLRKVIER